GDGIDEEAEAARAHRIAVSEASLNPLAWTGSQPPAPVAPAHHQPML
ncbi:MAG: hypothetical protein QOE90_2267, partial [Thermoplasmata archaeon]|nr:hypothetical protein [Thermoplasmata archaeon]